MTPEDQQHLDNAKRASSIALSIRQKDTISEEDREWLKDQMEKKTGTRDLDEANRRMDVVWGWRLERDDDAN
ncbi:hypothetical protein [Haloarchaeobius sp. DFWS5]|uniref:hypothetical protein n=1 Tax=Haloarchaeobius sp. DFWS5 TaxID=3446114 RepID=UPI003EBEB725